MQSTSPIFQSSTVQKTFGAVSSKPSPSCPRLVRTAPRLPQKSLAPEPLSGFAPKSLRNFLRYPEMGAVLGWAAVHLTPSTLCASELAPHGRLSWLF